MANILILNSASYIFGKEVVAFEITQTLEDAGHKTLTMVNAWNDGKYTQKLKIRSYFKKPLWTVGTLLILPKAYLKARTIVRVLKPDVLSFSYIEVYFSEDYADVKNGYNLILNKEGKLSSQLIKFGKLKIKCVNIFDLLINWYGN